MGSFRVAGVYYDYASNQGTVMMDLDVYRHHFASIDPVMSPQTLSIFLKPDSDTDKVHRRIMERLGPAEHMYCVTSSEIRREALRISDSTFIVTYALQLIAISMAGFGVASTLINLIYYRQREIGLLSLIGASYAQVRRIILFEAIVLGVTSQLVGIGIGIALAMVLIFVINV